MDGVEAGIWRPLSQFSPQFVREGVGQCKRFDFVTLANFRLCECSLLAKSRTKTLAASWLSMMWTVDDLCVLETPNIASFFLSPFLQ